MRFGDLARHGLQQLVGIQNGAHVLTQLAQDLLGIVGLAEEAAIHPTANALAEPADAHHQHYGNRNLREPRWDGVWPLSAVPTAKKITAMIRPA